MPDPISAARSRFRYDPSMFKGLKYAWLTISLFGLFACAPYIVTGDGERIRADSTDFRDYAERVFREHNNVTTLLAYAIDDLEVTDGIHDPREHEQLLEADDQMMQACSTLDEMVIARRDNREISLTALKRTAELIPDCEAATRAAANLIPDYK